MKKEKEKEKKFNVKKAMKKIMKIHGKDLLKLAKE